MSPNKTSGTITVQRRVFIVGVIGAHEGNQDLLDRAFDLGQKIAERGYVLLTGGGGGVMRSASQGAWMSGGLVIGVLPSDRQQPKKGYPNQFVSIPIYTGMSDARNVINVKSSNVVVALEGGPGTLSEVALAIKAGTPVILLACPQFEQLTQSQVVAVQAVQEAMREIDQIAASRTG